MILIDYNQIFLSNIFAQKQFDINEDLVRHTVLSCLLSYKKKFSNEYGKIVLCSDGRKYWRKNIFPYYKANRKKVRNSLNVDWTVVFDCLSKIREEIDNYMPYKILTIETLEADDIIATIVKMRSNDENILILSGDQDFVQLQLYPNVKQYSPIQKKFITTDDPKRFLQEKILRGDVGDGIPNFLSDDDCLVSPTKRQTPLREKKLQDYLNRKIEEYEPNLLKNFERNRALIDLLDYIPPGNEELVIQKFDKPKEYNSKKMMDYFMRSGLRMLMENLTEF